VHLVASHGWLVALAPLVLVIHVQAAYRSSNRDLSGVSGWNSAIFRSWQSSQVYVRGGVSSMEQK
jgi:hypothetical protein